MYRQTSFFLAMLAVASFGTAASAAPQLASAIDIGSARVIQGDGPMTVIVALKLRQASGLRVLDVANLADALR